MTTVSLQWFATHWSETAQANRDAIADGWDLADDLIRLHLVAADRLSNKVKADVLNSSLTASDEATLGLVCHGANVFTAVMIDIVRGLWDVSSLLVRGMLDIQSLTYACASREQMAKEFLAGKLEASACRKLVVEDLRSQGSPLADVINDRFKTQKWIADSLAHVKVIHTSKVMQMAGAVVTPTVWGRHEPLEALEQTKVALESENWQLSWVGGFKPGVVGTDWVAQLGELKPRIGAFMAR